MDTPSTASEHTPSADQARWFANEVHPHESALKGYLRGSFPSVRDIDDVVQESYLRILKARAAHPLNSARAFLFSVARRLAIDVIRKNMRTSARETVMDLSTANVLIDKADVAETVSIDEEFTLLAEAIHALPARCRQIMILRKLERLSHQAISERFGISISTVEVQISRGMGKCTEYLRSRGVEIPKKGAP